MKSFLRVAIALFAALVLVLAALAAYLSFVFDPNDYRDRLAEAVESHTGRSFVLEGDIALSLFPWLGFEVGAMELGNAAGFSERPFATLASAEARVRLLPLLSKEVAIDRIRLNGLRLNLERARDGRTNWEDLTADEPAQESEEAGRGAGEQDASPGPVALAVGGIEVRDAAIHWSDAGSGREDVLSGVDLKVGAITPGEPFDFDAGADFSIKEPAADGRLTLAGRAVLDLAAQRYRLDGLRATLKAAGAGLPGGAIDAGLMANAAADLQAGTASLSSLSLKGLGMQATGTVEASALDTEPRYRGRLEVAGFNPRELIKALGMTPPATSNPERLKRARFKATVEGSTQRVALTDIAASLDDSTLSGSVEVPRLEAGALRFDLRVDALDVDSYLPPAAAKGAPSGERKATTKAGDAPGAGEPLDLRELDVAGRIEVGKLKVAGLQASAMEVGVKAAGGRLQLTPKAALYDGNLAATALLEARGAPTVVSLDGTLEGVQLGPLLRDLSGKPERLTGRGRVVARLKGVGLDADRLKRTLAGTVEMKVADGAVKGVNVAGFLREAEARLTGKRAAAESGPAQTDFTDLVASLQVGEGVVRNDDLALRSPLLRVGGEGTANLVSERIDYLLKASLVGTLTGQGGKSLDQVRGVTVPVRVGGSFANPSYALDAEALVRDQAEAVVKEKAAEVREKAKEGLKKELEKGLKGLFR